MYNNNSGILDSLKFQFVYGGLIIKLVFINVAIFLVMLLFSIIDQHFISGGVINAIIYDLVAVPADLKTLATRFWTPISYMFIHSTESIFHILFNMFALWWFGNKLVAFQHESKILPYYFIGGFAGVIAYLAFYNFSGNLNHVSATMVGASASVMCVLFASIAFSPNYPTHLPIFGEVKLMYIGIVFFLIDLASISKGANTGGHVAHIGGALAGYLTVKQMQRGNDIVTPLEKLFKWMGDLFRKKPNLTVVKKDFEPGRYQKVKKVNSPRETQAEVDKILDKINEKGYGSLSKEEREFLFTYSKEN